ncbi:ATP-binding cassette domain-containing protein, partial [Streptomyces sp. ME01-18a]|uniref:ATP-binding cassette domain-containing protein n=1 Tax=Streptomyces sp. ME01-18a TaxID=3028669 RepID=UPI0029AB46D0
MENAIELRELTKTYGSRRGLTGLTLDVSAGEVFGFLGPNGAGKSTTIRLLLDLIRPTSGTARVLRSYLIWANSVFCESWWGSLSGWCRTSCGSCSS